ncbi:MAG: VWA domain-containing protein [Caldilineaceae bacterium]
MNIQHMRPQLIAAVVLIFTLLLNGCAAGGFPVQAPAPTSNNRAEAPAADAGASAPAAEEGAPAEQSSVSVQPAGESAERAIVAPAAPAAASGGAAADVAAASSRSEAASSPVTRQERYEPVTAGVVDDNEEWDDYLDYRNRHRSVYVNDRDISERYIISVQDQDGMPVHDATVQISVNDASVYEAQTDAGGRVLFHPLALDTLRGWQRNLEFQVLAQKEWVAARATFERYAQTTWTLTLVDAPAPGYTQLDLLFVVDATGSMDDEIAKLKSSMADVADQIDNLPERPDVRYGLVHYRDRGDSYVVRTVDFTPNLNDFQYELAALRAGGGGDYPESVNEALHSALNDLHWRSPERGGDTLRLMILVADAPPHLDYRWEDFSYDTDMIEAARRGIKIFPVGASGLDEQGEYIFRQMAQFTGGKFIFLTYEDGDDPSSGPGTETSHDVDNYSVNTLDKLIVRLVRDELAKLNQPIAAEAASVPVQVRPTPTPQPPLEPVSCTVNLQEGRNDCGGIGVIEYIDMAASGRRQPGQAVVKLNLDPRHTGYTRVRFDVQYGDTPTGVSVHIGDSASNSGRGGDRGDQSNNAEVVLVDGNLVVYGNDYTPSGQALDGRRKLAEYSDVVRAGETISLDVSNERLGINGPAGIELVESPYLFALDGQVDRSGPQNYELFAAFNRTIAADNWSSTGVEEVTITLYPR